MLFAPNSDVEYAPKIRVSQHAISFYLAIFISLLWSVYCEAADPVGITITQDILVDYNTFVAKRDVASIQQYSGPGARRDVIELVLLQQALLLGGFNQPIVMHPEQNYLRGLRNIAEGQDITSAGLVWKDDITALGNSVYISRPIVHDGEFVIGLYTSPKNTTALSAKTREDLIELRAVTSAQWRPDFNALTQLGVKQILLTPSWVNMVRMVEAGRADMTIAPFQPTPGMAFEASGGTMIPIPGVKLCLHGSRHWPVSKEHPQGKAFFEALERGLEQLEKTGTIQRAYRECGFFHPDVAEWKLLNP
jgi:hypothetical protein